MPHSITAKELKSLLDARPDLPVVDVRTPAEFDQVHVPSAVNLPLDTLSPATLNAALPATAGEAFYVLCRSGARAELALTKLGDGGARGLVVKGGTAAWEQAGFPVVRGESKVIGLERQVRIAAGALVLTGALLGWFVHQGFFGLSAFVGAGLIFAGLTDWCGMGLLLSRAPWNQRKSL